MNGIHDMGGMHGFGPVVVEANEPVFHAAWEERVFGMVMLALGTGIANIDRFRHAVERLDPVEYLSAGYYGRWLGALETSVREWGERGETRDSIDGRSLRQITSTPRFALEEAVRVRNLQPAGHTRLPGYVRGKCGGIARVHPAFILPDSHAHGLGEHPQWVYAVRFDSTELFGSTAEPNTSVHVDLFESYLEHV
ncbi:MAG: nitrile hydratase subunit beta [Solirubrobacteraceae bacterium]